MNENNTNTPLPIGTIIIHSLLLPIALRRQLLIGLVIPILLLVTIGYAQHFIDSDNFFVSLIFVVMTLLVYCFFAATCHRIVLLNNNEVTITGILKWGNRELRFLGWIIAISIFFGVSVFILSILVKTIVKQIEGTGVAELIIYLALMPGFYIISRLSLIFPATALDKRPDLEWAWTMSKNNGWRLFVVVGILPFVFSYIQSVIERENSTIIEDIIIMLISFVFLVVEIFALSLSYKKLALENEL